eukprot:1061720-Rhodomonas_salina.1
MRICVERSLSLRLGALAFVPIAHARTREKTREETRARLADSDLEGGKGLESASEVEQRVERRRSLRRRRAVQGA